MRRKLGDIDSAIGEDISTSCVVDEKSLSIAGDCKSGLSTREVGNALFANTI
jgi:hypothetical protein